LQKNVVFKATEVAIITEQTCYAKLAKTTNYESEIMNVFSCWLHHDCWLWVVTGFHLSDFTQQVHSGT